MRVLVCGDRDWKDRETIYKRLSSLPPETIIIEGDCRGADRTAGEVATGLGFEVLAFPVDWRGGSWRGPARNKQMLREGKPELVIAFHSDLDKSKGTAGMIKLARKAGVPVEVIGG